MPPRLFPDEPEPRHPQNEGLSIDPTERPYYAGEDEPRRSGMIRNILVVCVMLGCAGAIYFAYNKGKQAGAGPGGAIPLIRADQDPTKRKPDDAGGSTPDQDKLVYNPNDPNGAKVERLLPPPEQPLPKPVPAPGATDTLPVQNIAPVATPQAAPPTAAVGVATNSASQQANTTGMMSAPAGAKAVPGIEIPPLPPAQPAQAQTTPGKPVPLTPAAAATTGPLRIQIAATKDEPSARAEFARLQKAHADLLGNLSATVVKADLGDKGVFYRIQAGPIADKAQADKLCSQLKPLGIGCIVVH
jgi:cell division septation protein DedD